MPLPVKTLTARDVERFYAMMVTEGGCRATGSRLIAHQLQGIEALVPDSFYDLAIQGGCAALEDLPYGELTATLAAAREANVDFLGDLTRLLARIQGAAQEPDQAPARTLTLDPAGGTA